MCDTVTFPFYVDDVMVEKFQNRKRYDISDLIYITTAAETQEKNFNV